MDKPTRFVAKLAGRCTTGEELGQGKHCHIVKGTVESHHGGFGVALCGAKPGRRSAGWSRWPEMVATCPRCIARNGRNAAESRANEAKAFATPHPSETAEYWRKLARSERAFAEQDRGNRFASAESVRIHLRNAEDYERRAKELQGTEFRGKTVAPSTTANSKEGPG